MVSKKRRKEIARLGGIKGGAAPHKTRYLEIADKKTRQEIARLGGLIGGKIRAMDKEGLSEAGKVGGNKVKEVYGVVFFSTISQKRKNKRGRNSYHHHNKDNNKKQKQDT